MLEAKEIYKYYGSKLAVQPISFSLEPGQVLAYLGPNGSGKSTTVKMITGLLDPTGGEILCEGRNVHDDLTRFRKRLGYVPEEANLYPHLSGEEFLEMVATLRAMPKPRARKAIDSLLQLFALWQHRQVTMGSYSKGMRQRILLIAALMDNPDVLILDEPQSGLDVTSSLIIRDLISSLSAQGKAIFYCSHILEVVEKVATHVIVLRKGQVVARGTIREVRERIGKESLEGVFLELVEERDVAQVVDDIVGVVVQA